MRLVLGALLLVVAGCATRPQPVEVFRTVEVKVPVAVPCVAEQQVPQRPAGLGELPESQASALSRALERLLEWRHYGERADALLRACAEQP